MSSIVDTLGTIAGVAILGGIAIKVTEKMFDQPKPRRSTKRKSKPSYLRFGNFRNLGI